MKLFLDLKDTIIFDIFKIITGKIYIITTVFLFVVYAVYKLKRRAIIFILAAIISISVSDLICYRILKPAIGRLRPSVELKYLNKENINTNISRRTSKNDFSMPSNHASNIFSFFIVYSIYVRRYWIFALINSLLIAVSRVIVGKHYPTDVLAGIFTGTLIGLCVIFLFYLIDQFRKAEIKKTV